MLSASRASARSVAIAQLGRLARAAAIPTIEEHLGDPSPEVRAACARAIAYSASAEGLAPLRKLAADAHPTVRHAAVLAIAALRLPEAHALLERALRDKDSAVRKAALTAVAALNDLNSLRSATRDADLSVALHAGQLLAKQGEVQPVLNAIAMALVDPLWTLRATALNTASSVNDRVAWRLGTKGLRDPQPEVRLAAARMLQTHHLRPKAVSRAIASLVAQFCDGRHQLPEQCIQATELLLREDADVGSKRLHRLAVSRIRWQYRRAAYYLLFARETRPASAGVLDALSDSEPRVALLAAVHVLRHL